MNEKILIIDDEEEILEVLAEVFEEEGYQVKKGHDGEHGIALFQEWQPDLVITDVKMPRKNGLDRLMANIRKHNFSSDGSNATLTVSVGVALCPDQADEASALISLADKTLYQAKEAGRDRVVFSG
ncbi:MAG: response regulator [Desulfocapsaceae bacterium]|nr:response regulator [Desulfocapsaceae bacterium]